MRSERMGPDSLRRINASSGPLNTIGSRRKPSDVYFTGDHHPSKRRSPDASRANTLSESRYFLASKPPTPDHVQDLARPSSHDDCFDFTISGGDNSQRPGRKSRILSRLRPATSASSSERDARPAESPDILVGGPAMQPQSPVKRNLQSETPGPPSKFTKWRSAKEDAEEGSSEDELSRVRERVNNFTTIFDPRDRGRTGIRGDIGPTWFKNSGRPQVSSSSHLPGLILKRAACGKDYYESHDSRQKQIILRPESNNSLKLVPTTANDQELAPSWLHINIQTCFQILHAATGSPCVVVRRPSTAGSNARLCLEFTDIQTASDFVSMAHSEKNKEKPAAEVEAMVQKAIDEAQKYSAANARRYAEKLAEYDATPWSASRFTSEMAQDSFPRREKLTDRLRSSARTSHYHPVDVSDHGELSLLSNTRNTPRPQYTTRSSPSSLGSGKSPDRWTSQNPDWRERWPRSLVFPATGMNRATVDDDDIPRLDEGNFLNDNLISFYLRYLQAQLEKNRPELLKKIYIFSTFFFEKLRSTKAKINYDGVKTWTAKFDLFSYDYIVVPVNEHAHWYLAIICNVPNSLHGILPQPDVEVIDIPQEHPNPNVVFPIPSSLTRTTREKSSSVVGPTPTGGGAQNLDQKQPKIVTLDSLGSPHYLTCKALKDYLVEEAKRKRGVDLAMIPNGMKAKGIPEQDNHCDCGVFVLGYIEEFLKNPDEAARKMLQKERPGWDIQPSTLRNRIRTLLFELQEEQQDRPGKGRKDERKSAAKAKAVNKEKLQTSQTALVSNASAEEFPESESAGIVGSLTPVDKNARGKKQEWVSSNDASSPKNSRSPKRTPMPCNNNPKFVNGLKNEDLNNSTSAPGPTFYSARSSPEAKCSKAGAQAAGEFISSLDIKNPHFISTLPSSSDSETGDGAAKSQTEREPSVELIRDGTVMWPSLERATKAGGSISIEIPSPGTQDGYDGIDRSVDIT